MLTLEKRIYLCVILINLVGNQGKDTSRKELIFPMLMRDNCSVFSYKNSSFVV